tara:strand:- start:108 stop:536 length:429 start_codon:yes stop_codon:yes gene_type:complete
MPGNIFANTPTNITILFIDKNLSKDEIVLIDASKKGYSENSGKKKRTYLSPEDEELIVNAVKNKKKIDKFSIVVSSDEIKEEDYSLSAMQYFDQKIDFIEMSEKDFHAKVSKEREQLLTNFAENEKIKKDINEILKKFDEKL